MFASSTLALGTAWLGRQSADHLGLEPGMLWVQIPPELLETKYMSSQSSQECSPPCHGGDRRFKSDRGRFCSAVRKLAKRRSSNLRGLWVRLPPVLLPDASVGHWHASVAVTHPLSSSAGSTPARRTFKMARCDAGTCSEPFKLAVTGSIPVRVTVKQGPV